MKYSRVVLMVGHPDKRKAKPTKQTRRSRQVRGLSLLRAQIEQEVRDRHPVCPLVERRIACSACGYPSGEACYANLDEYLAETANETS